MLTKIKSLIARVLGKPKPPVQEDTDNARGNGERAWLDFMQHEKAPESQSTQTAPQPSCNELITGTCAKPKKKRTTYHRLTLDERKAVLKLLELGFSIQQLQDYFGCSCGSVVETARGNFSGSSLLLSEDYPLMFDHLGKFVAAPSKSKCTATKQAIGEAVKYLDKNNLFDKEYFHEAFDVSYVLIAAVRKAGD